MPWDYIWACEPYALDTYFEAFLLQESISIPEGFSLEKEESILSVSGSRAEISIIGMLTPFGPSWIQKFLGVQGTAYKDIIAAVVAANADSNVTEIVLNVDSPGGTIKGLDEVWSAIKNTDKKVMAVNRGLMASAAYYLSSAADTIIASDPSVRTGSIGVLVSGWDTKVAQEKSGRVYRTITSSNAPKKALDLSTEEGRTEIRAEIDALERLFYKRISEGRGITTDEIKQKYRQGAVLIARDPDSSQVDALSAGMIDAVRNDGIQKEDDMTMTLVEMLSDPGVKAAIEAARKEGAEAGSQKEQQRIALASKIATGEYPKPIRELAGKVLEDTESADVLKGAVTVYEAMREGDALKNAVAKTKELGETATTEPALSDTKKQDPNMLSADDLKAAIMEG